VLAGLISDEDRRTANRVPGLGDMRCSAACFSQTTIVAKDEIILLITPRLVARSPAAWRGRVRRRHEASAASACRGALPALPPSFPVQPAQPDIPQQPPVFPGAARPGADVPLTPAQPPASPTGPEMVPFGGQKPPRNE